MEEIAQCVEAILGTEVGTRLELPGFGLLEQAFREGGASLQELQVAIAQWEPRATALPERDREQLDSLIDYVKVTVDRSERDG